MKVGLVKRYDGRAPYDMFRARLMFPIRDAQGRVIGFSGRVLDESLPKYINSPESPLYSKARAVYGIYEARQTIAKARSRDRGRGQYRRNRAVAGGVQGDRRELGTALTVDQLRLLARYTHNIFACFDGDAAGRKASLRALEVFLGAGLLGRGVFIPTGFDPDTLVRDRGAQAFSELIESSELLVDFFLREQADAAGASVSGRARAAERVAEILRMIANPFEFDLLARKAADFLGVSEELLRKEAQKGRGANQAPRHAVASPAPRAARPTSSGDAVAQAEIGLVAIALNYPDLRTEIAAQLMPEPRGDAAEGLAPAEFHDPMLAAMLEDICLSEEAQTSLEVRIMAGLSEEQRERLSGLVVGPLMANADDASKMTTDFIAALARNRRQREVENLRRVAADTRGEDAAAAAQALITLRRQSHEGG